VQLTGLNRNSVNRLLACLRERMAQACELEQPLRGHVEVDEGYLARQSSASVAFDKSSRIYRLDAPILL
jgi:hypothetical protein